jgi:hypothetical protein
LGSPLLLPPESRSDGRPEHAQLQGLRALTRLMDEAVAVPGTRFRVGLDSLLGFIPGVGDLAGAAVSGYALLVAVRLRAPVAVLLRMLVNIGVDALTGVVPFVGDLFDLAWKANRRNLRLLEEYLEQPAATTRTSRSVVAGVSVLFVLLLGLVLWGTAALIRTLVRLVSG